jgi:hypothetical protein
MTLLCRIALLYKQRWLCYKRGPESSGQPFDKLRAFSRQGAAGSEKALTAESAEKDLILDAKDTKSANIGQD